MGLSKINPTTLNSWSGLEKKFKAEGDNHISSFFEESDRLEEFTISWKDFYVDFSKNRLSSSTLKLLIDLSNETNLKNNIEKYFDGSTINETEKRWLREPKNPKLINVNKTSR